MLTTTPRGVLLPGPASPCPPAPRSAPLILHSGADSAAKSPGAQAYAKAGRYGHVPFSRKATHRAQVGGSKAGESEEKSSSSRLILPGHPAQRMALMCAPEQGTTETRRDRCKRPHS